MKVIVTKPPVEPPKIGSNSISMFLAGSIEMGAAEMWQDEIAEYVRTIADVNIEEIHIYNPRRDNWDKDWKQSEDNPNFVKQVEWELEQIQRSDIVAFYLQPGTNSPISLLELGIVSNDAFAMRKHVIVLCPEGFHRKGNVDITAMWFDMTRAKNMDDFKEKIRLAIQDIQFNDLSDLDEKLSEM